MQHCVRQLVSCGAQKESQAERVVSVGKPGETQEENAERIRRVRCNPKNCQSLCVICTNYYIKYGVTTALLFNPPSARLSLLRSVAVCYRRCAEHAHKEERVAHKLLKLVVQIIPSGARLHCKRESQN